MRDQDLLAEAYEAAEAVLQEKWSPAARAAALVARRKKHKGAWGRNLRRQLGRMGHLTEQPPVRPGSGRRTRASDRQARRDFRKEERADHTKALHDLAASRGVRLPKGTAAPTRRAYVDAAEKHGLISSAGAASYRRRYGIHGDGAVTPREPAGRAKPPGRGSGGPRRPPAKKPPQRGGGSSQMTVGQVSEEIQRLRLLTKKSRTPDEQARLEKLERALARHRHKGGRGGFGQASVAG